MRLVRRMHSSWHLQLKAAARHYSCKPPQPCAWRRMHHNHPVSCMPCGLHILMGAHMCLSHWLPQLFMWLPQPFIWLPQPYLAKHEASPSQSCGRGRQLLPAASWVVLGPHPPPHSDVLAGVTGRVSSLTCHTPVRASRLQAACR